MISFNEMETFSYIFPQSVEPLWKEKVERWYQLDPLSYGLCEAVSQWKTQILPDIILLASPGASNFMDSQFVATGANSPSKFVYTLPSVRGTPLCQVLNWRGPLWCFQKDPMTIWAGIEQAQFFLSKYSRIWLMGSMPVPNGSEQFLSFRMTWEPIRQVNFGSKVENLNQMSDIEFLNKLRSSGN